MIELVHIVQNSHVFFTRGIILEDFLTHFTLNLCIVVDISHVPSKIHNCLLTDLTPVVSP